MYKKILYTLLSLFIGFNSYGQVVINEFSCSNVTTLNDNYGQKEDWIELYNTSAAAIDLTGYFLSDGQANPGKWMIPSGTIAANGYKVIFASGRDEVSGGNLHTNFKLTQASQEYIVLSAPNLSLIDSYWIQKSTQSNHSRGRQTNGSMYWGVFTTPTPGASNVNAKQEYATKPILNVASGYYASSVTLSMSSPDAGVTIRYTVDGNEPTTGSTQYSTPISISTTQVVKAKAFSSDPTIPASFTETNTYFIGDSHTIPVVSIAGDQVDNLLNGNSIEPVGSFELFGANGVLVDEANGDYNKHGNDSWAYDQRGCDYVTRDEYGYSNNIEDQIFRTKTRTKFQRLILKPAANDNYPFEDGAHIRDAYVHSLSQIGNLKLDERSYEPCILYVNGQYWGVYELREKVDDHDFTDYYYNQGKNDLQYLKTWGGTWSEYGGAQAQTDWDNLKNFILGNDMTIPANFTYVDSLYNWQSLVDYFVLNSYVVCSDWLNWNTSWWRGLNPNGDKQKWRYSLWDMDATFGHYINYTGIPDQTPGADPCNPEALGNPGGQGHVPILNALMNNATFEQYYISRYIDLSNTVFSCDFMIHHLDSLIDMIQPEMQDQVNRWGGTYAGWEANVQDLRDFINAKCAEFDGGMIDCYDLDGPYDVTFVVDPPLTGKIKVNSDYLPGYPYVGSYFGGVDVLLKANAFSGWMFDYWELNNHTVSPGSTVEDVVLALTQGDTVIAHFKTSINLDLGNDTLLCLGETLTLDAGLQDSTSTYLWSNNSTGRYLTVNTAGTYSVTVTNACCTASDNIVITYLNPPVVNLGVDFTLCDGETQMLDAGTSGTTYLWQNSSASQTFLVSSAGNYHVTITNQCGSDIDTINVDYASPPVINLGPDANICEGDILLLDAGFPNMIYTWQDGSHLQTFNVTSAGTYSVTVDNGFGCLGFDVREISMFNSFDVTAGPEQTICRGMSVNISATGGSFYAWSPAESLDDPTAQSVVASPDHTTNYVVTVSDVTGCSYMAIATITVITDVQLSLVADLPAICPGDEVVFTAEASEGTGGPYFYYDMVNELQNPTINVSFWKDTVYTLFAKDLCNNPVSAQVAIDVYDIPRVLFYTNSDVVGCEPLTVNFQDAFPIEDNNYFWSFGDEAYSMDRVVEHKYQSSGVYDVSLTVTDEHGCDSTFTIEDMITVNRVPTALFYPEPSVATIVNPKFEFLNLSEGHTESIWDFGDGTSSSEESPPHEYNYIDSFEVRLVVRTEEGCSDDIKGIAVVEDEYTFYAPTAIVPQSDISDNHKFGVYINGLDARYFHLIIYNRWGEKVFETYNPDHHWDGTKKGGKFEPTGVYTWYVNYSDTQGQLHEEKGSVTVIR